MDYGELTFYIQALKFSSKQDLKGQLEQLLKNASDELEKGSILTALAILEGVSEEELKQIKESI